MSMFSFILGKHLEVELLNHKVSIHNFRDAALTVYKVVETFRQHIMKIPVLFSKSKECPMIFYHGFNLHFLVER